MQKLLQNCVRRKLRYSKKNMNDNFRIFYFLQINMKLMLNASKKVAQTHKIIAAT